MFGIRIKSIIDDLCVSLPMPKTLAILCLQGLLCFNTVVFPANCLADEYDRQGDIEQAINLIDNDNYAAAREVIEAALAQTEDEDEQGMSDAPGAQQAMLLYILARIDFAENELSAANSNIERALTLRKSIFGAEHPLVAQALTLQAKVYRKANNDAQAENSLKQAIAIWEQLSWPISKDADDTANTYISFLNDHNRQVEGEKLKETLAALNRKSSNMQISKVDDDGSLWSTYILAAQKAHAEGKVKESEKLYKKALTEAQASDRNWKLMQSYLVLLAFLRTEGRNKEATELANQARTEKLDLSKVSASDQLNYYLQLANVFEQANDYASAISAIKTAQDTCNKLSDKTEKEAKEIEVQLELAQVLAKAGRQAQANNICQNLEKKAQSLEPAKQQQVLSDIAQCLNQSKQSQRAEQVYTKLKQAANKSGTKLSPQDYEKQGQLALAMEKYSEAEKYLTLAINTADETLKADPNGNIDPIILSSYISLSKLAYQQKQYVKVVKICKKIGELATNNMNMEDKDTLEKKAVAFNYIAKRALQFNLKDDASNWLQQEISIEESLLCNPNNWSELNTKSKREHLENKLSDAQCELATISLSRHRYNSAFQLLKSALSGDKTVEAALALRANSPVKEMPLNGNDMELIFPDHDSPSSAYTRDRTCRKVMLLALSLHQLGYMKPAEALYTYAANLIVNRAQDKSLMLANLYENYALLLKETDRSGKAFYVAQAAYDIRKHIYDADKAKSKHQYARPAAKIGNILNELQDGNTGPDTL